MSKIQETVGFTKAYAKSHLQNTLVTFHTSSKDTGIGTAFLYNHETDFEKSLKWLVEGNIINFQSLNKFDGFEMHKVLEFSLDGERFCDQVEDDYEPEYDDEKCFWGVSGHIPNAGLEWLADYETKEEARKIFESLAKLINRE